MASNLRFGYSDKFLQLVKLLETFAFRAYEVVGASRQARRRKFREVSYRLYYADRKSILEDVFGAEQKKSKVYNNLNEGFRSAAREIENGIGNYGSDQQFDHNLKRYDVVRGGLNEDGWNGFRRKKSILYFLTRMNDQVFEKVERSEFRVPNTNGREVFLEYIWPLDSSLIPADLQIEHQRQRRRLGNLAFTLEDFDDHEDLSYEQKFSRLYNNPDNPQMIRRLPDPSEGWDHTDIEERLEEMVTFALNSWEIKSGANIEVEKWGSLDMGQSEAEQQLRTLVRDNFEENQPFVPKEINHLPKIRINEPESFGPLTEKSGCPSCGSTIMIISEQNGSLSYKCTCGEVLVKPSVSYYFNEY
jgi:hypothetical protein